MTFTPEQAAELAEKLFSIKLHANFGSMLIEAAGLAAIINAALEQQAKEASEVVAWMYVNDDGECEEIGPIDRYDGEVPECSTPLYKTPPQPESVKTALRKAAEIAKRVVVDNKLPYVPEDMEKAILALIDKEN